MLEVKLYNLGYCKESEYTRVVCVSDIKENMFFATTKKEMVLKYQEDT